MTKKVQIRCRECGKTMRADEYLSVVNCPHCGCSNYIEMSQVCAEDPDQCKRWNHDHQIQKVRYSFTLQSVVLTLFMIFVVIGSFFCFTNDLPVAGMIMMIQLIISGLALYMGIHATEIGHAGLRVFLTILVFALSIPWAYTMEYYDKYGDDIEWKTFYLGEHAPDLDGSVGCIDLNYDSVLNLKIGFIDEQQMEEYIDRCRDFGYTAEEYYEDFGPYCEFDAYNQEGYHLNLTHFHSEDRLFFNLHSPIEIEDLTWPERLNGILPEIPMEHGRIEINDESVFCFYAGDMDRDAYNDYVDQACSFGYSHNFERRENYFSGYHSNGTQLEIYYEGFHIIMIRVEFPMSED